MRLLLWLLLLNALVDILTAYDEFIANPNPPSSLGLWITLALGFWVLPDLVNVGFGLSWGRWPQVIAALLGVLAIFGNLIRYGKIYGLMTGLLVYVLVVWLISHVFLSLLVQVIFATPG